MKNPTIENYHKISPKLTDALALTSGDRYEWLKNSYDNIDKFKSQTGKLFIWDTTPDYEEVVVNLIQTLIRYNMKLYLLGDKVANDAPIKLLMTKYAPNIKIRTVSDVESVPSNGLLFDTIPPWLLNYNDSYVCDTNTYFYVSIVDENWAGADVSADDLFIGDFKLMDIQINQPIIKDPEQITPQFRLQREDVMTKSCCMYRR